MDSSGFEHVFVGETKTGSEIIGFHNWLQFYLQEKHGHLDYKGYKARVQDIVRLGVDVIPFSELVSVEYRQISYYVNVCSTCGGKLISILYL